MAKDTQTIRAALVRAGDTLANERGPNEVLKVTSAPRAGFVRLVLSFGTTPVAFQDVARDALLEVFRRS